MAYSITKERIKDLQNFLLENPIDPHMMKHARSSMILSTKTFFDSLVLEMLMIY